MNARILGLTALLLASAATSTLAQDRDIFGRSRSAPAAPQAQPAPVAPTPPISAPVERRERSADAPRSGWSRQDGERRVAPRVESRDNPRFDDRRHRWSRAEENRDPAAERREQQRRDEWRSDDRRTRDERWRDRRGDDYRNDEGRDRDRRQEWRDDRRRDHGDRGRQHWTRDRYPPIYNSPYRYRGPVWQAPSGYYARSWRYGEIMPRGWYGPDYQILDWWSYDLPEPPPGYEWIRSGSDVLLVDLYSGRIVQVVRLLFR